jgi:glycosyltransferase involved in cell wall biosynthesis
VRILVAHPGMNIKGGGEQAVIYSMLACLKMGHEVTLVSEEFDTALFEDFYGCPGLFEKVDRLSYPPFKPMMGRGLLLYQRLYHYQRQFKRLVPTRPSFDLLLGTQDVGYTPVTSIPEIQYCHFPEQFKHLQSNSVSRVWRLYYGPARVFYRKRARLIYQFLTNSEYTRGFIRQIWDRDSRVIYGPCRLDLYSPQPKEDLVATVGRISPEKRLHLFLEIARHLPGFKFAIIGSVHNDAYFNWLENNAPANVSFIVSPLRKSPEILGKAKIYVHCMENEHFGIAIVEAMAAGCVPVVHDSGGPREIVIPEVGYRWRNVDEAVGQITTLIQDVSLSQQMSKAAFERSKLFSTERFENRLREVLTDFEKPGGDGFYSMSEKPLLDRRVVFFQQAKDLQSSLRPAIA